MELQDIKITALVEHSEHAEWGVGEILRSDGARVVIDFPHHPENREQAMSKSEALIQLKALPHEGLELAFRENADSVRSWVYEGQLRLLGATLADLGGEGKVGMLQSRLEGRILGPMNTTWKTWWDKTRPLAEKSGHFEMLKSKPVRLLSRVEDIPMESAFPQARTAAQPRKESLTNRAMSLELDQQRQAHLADLRQQRQAHEAELRQQREHHAAEIVLQREHHAAELQLQRDTYTAALEEKRLEYEAQLEKERNLVDGLRSRIAKSREESRLDIRRGMLEVIAESLKGLQRNQEKSSEALLRDAVAGLEIAIQAGGAEWFGKPGELAEFDPRLYDGVAGAERGESVKVKSRGAMVPGNLTDDFILIKARVSRPTEVTYCKLSE